ncbi:hypothetical protein FPV16_00755 [Methylobacterium sp. W2]|uniref:hypothetical protein n=1 Tax=Methylobacterium sp. W2 TaxID=2598107 RepID=UPI001D0C2D30|nr:hypothetical protein [Methylobacterium sp. W2]MCC0804761.1 hypothetical protein [Methylobacterium sp. W2]
MKTRFPLILPVLVALVATASPASAQTAIKLEGSCEKLIVAGLDITKNCKDTMMNTVSRNRTSFDFSAWDGRSLSFSGSGAQQERTEETDALQPINLVVPGEKTDEGVVRGPLAAVGSCSFSNPQEGKTAITCEATSAKGRYEARFVTDSKTPPGAPKP